MNLTPKEIVRQLDKFIVGQNEAKKAVAIALRNRYRRSLLSEEAREEITPKNIIMKGPTGVGKTEIARRLAKLVKAPFVKVEATKYTEVGYVGRDVESMVRDLVECSIRLVKEEKKKDVIYKATRVAENKIVKILMTARKTDKGEMTDDVFKTQLLENLRKGYFDNEIVEIEVADTPKSMEVVPGGAEISIGSIFGDMMPKKTKKRKLAVKDAMAIIIAEESERLIDNDAVNVEGIRRAEQEGIIFIDEIDKIAGKAKSGSADVSREGVQRDILPIVEGSTVMTKYGAIKTDYVLFISAGAFHVAKVGDLIPELQGRFPIIVELQSLTKADFIEILTTPENAITRQYEVLLATENIDLKFTKEAIELIAELSENLNETREDIGARRLHTVMEKLIEEISFEGNESEQVLQIEIDKSYVENRFIKQFNNKDLKKYIL